jgi:NAD(P)-dependent dehydrogenase (short-subunit alcohol dehydrogenase family)
MDVTGKGALVTGGASGIGAAAVRRLAAAGARVAVADRDEDAARALAGEVGGIALSGDVAAPYGFRGVPGSAGGARPPGVSWADH